MDLLDMEDMEMRDMDNADMGDMDKDVDNMGV